MTQSSVIAVTKELNSALSELTFPENDKIMIFNSLGKRETLGLFEEYVNKYCQGRKNALFVGMNPTPSGMARTGVPFGDPDYVKSWLKLDGFVNEPIEDFDYKDSERSGKNLWSFLQSIFKDAEEFFRDNFIVNYCPLIFLSKDKSHMLSLENMVENEDRDGKKILSSEEYNRMKVYISDVLNACNDYLISMIGIIKPRHVIAFGNAVKEFVDDALRVSTVRHPSDLGRKGKRYANMDWQDIAMSQLIEAGVFTEEMRKKLQETTK